MSRIEFGCCFYLRSRRAVKGIETESFGGREMALHPVCSFGCVGRSERQMFEARPQGAVAFEQESEAFELGDRGERGGAHDPSVELQSSKLHGCPDGSLACARRRALESVEERFDASQVVVGDSSHFNGERALLLGSSGRAYPVGELA